MPARNVTVPRRAFVRTMIARNHANHLATSAPERTWMTIVRGGGQKNDEGNGHEKVYQVSPDFKEDVRGQLHTAGSTRNWWCGPRVEVDRASGTDGPGNGSNQGQSVVTLHHRPLVMSK
jgi:hypothetical protein